MKNGKITPAHIGAFFLILIKNNYHLHDKMCLMEISV